MTISRFAWPISTLLLGVLLLSSSPATDGLPEARYRLSDERLKTEVRDLNYGISEVLKLRPVRFKWKTSLEDGDDLGVIAQEIQKVIPEIVKYQKIDPEKRLSVDYQALIPVLIHGLQDQQKLITSQQDRVAAQQTQLETLLVENHSLALRVDDLETAIIDVLTVINP